MAVAPNPAAMTEHAGLIIPALLWALGVLGALLAGAGALIGRAVWCRMEIQDRKLDAAISLLYGLCLEAHPEHLDCDDVRKALCGAKGE